MEYPKGTEIAVAKEMDHVISNAISAAVLNVLFLAVVLMERSVIPMG